jgi:DNA-directed RNA polymerase specialized sigma24 family protein
VKPMDETFQKNILQELRSIKKLLALNLLTGDSQTKQIGKLDSIGLKPKEIAEILGTTSNTVNVALNRLRKAKQNRDSTENHE